MMEKFKGFLAGAPNWMSADEVETWAYCVAVVFPNVMHGWYDPSFTEDSVWVKDGIYYEIARKRLSALGAFKKGCPNANDALQALKLLTLFFGAEKSAAAKGKTSKKKVKVEKKGDNRICRGKRLL